MDLLANLMNPNKTLQHIIVPSAQVDGAVQVELDETVTYDDSDMQMDDNISSNDYAKIYQERETALYAEATKQHTIKVRCAFRY